MEAILLRLKRMKLGPLFWSVVRFCLVAGISFIIIFPLLTQISTAIKAIEDLYDPTVIWLPKTVTLDNFKMAMTEMRYFSALVNSLIISVGVSLTQLLSCTFIGYGFARFKFRGRNLLFALVVLTLIIPPELIMIPLFLNFRYFNLFGLLGETGLNLLGSLWPYFILSITGTGLRNGLFIYIVRQYFRGMPIELEEAAYVDGAGPIRTFFTVMMPNAAPVMLIVFLFSFVWMYNDTFYSQLFMGGKDIMSSNLLALPLRIRYLSGPEVTVYHNAAIVLYLAPLIILYALLQRYFVESVERSGIVG